MTALALAQLTGYLTKYGLVCTDMAWSSQSCSLHSNHFLRPRQRVLGPNVEPHLQHHLLPAPIRPSGGQVDPLESSHLQVPFSSSVASHGKFDHGTVPICVELLLFPTWVDCVPLAALPVGSTGVAHSPTSSRWPSL